MSEAQLASETQRIPIAVYLLGLIAGLQLTDPAIANDAIVKAGRDLHFSPSELALGASISTLALAATVLATATAADRLGRKPVLIASLVVAIIGDLVVAAAPSPEIFLLGRALTGIGLGSVFAATFAYVRFVSRSSQVAAGLGIWAAVQVGVLIVFSVVGGMLANESWRLAMVLVPGLAFVFVLILLLVPKALVPMPRCGDGKVDYLGLFLIGASTVLVIYGISQASESLTAPSFWGLVLLGIIGYGLFALVESRSSNPAFPIKLFGSTIFVAAVVAGVAWNFGQAIAQFATSNFFQYVKLESTFTTTLLQEPFFIAMLVGSILAGRFISARPDGLRVAMGFGFGIAVVGFVLLGVMKQSWPSWVLIPGLILVAIGLSAVSVPQSAMFAAAAPKEYFGPVTSFRTTVGQVGYGVGTALATVLVQTFGKADFVPELYKEGLASPAQVGKGVDAVHIYLADHREPATEAGREALAAAAKAYTGGFDQTLLVTAGLVAALGVITMFLMRKRDDSPGSSPA